MCISSVGAVGILGNLLTCVVLARTSINSNFHQTIVALTIVNLIFVGMVVIDSFHPDLDLDNQLYIKLFPYLWHPAKAILLCCETYLVMSITTERFLAIKRPVRIHLINLHHHSHFRHFATFILPPILLAFFINLPKFFEFRLTKVGIDMVDWEPTELRLSSSYILFYNHWTRMLLTGILPFLHLLLLNLKIRTVLTRRSLRNQKVREEKDEKGSSLSCPSTNSKVVESSSAPSFPCRTSRGRSQSTAESTDGILLRVHCSHDRRQEINSNMVPMVAAVYLVTHSPRLVANLTECWIQVELSDCPQPPPHWLNLLVLVSHVCLTLNSSLNFFIYFGFSGKFQQYFNGKVELKVKAFPILFFC